MVCDAQGKTLNLNPDPLIVKDLVVMQLGNGQSVNVVGVTASKLSGLRKPKPLNSTYQRPTLRRPSIENRNNAEKILSALSPKFS
jgi:hypothetical protein